MEKLRHTASIKTNDRDHEDLLSNSLMKPAPLSASNSTVGEEMKTENDKKK